MPATMKIAARMADRCATARPLSRTSTCGICGGCRDGPKGAAASSSGRRLATALYSMPPMMRCMMAASTSDASSALNTKPCTNLSAGIENT